MLSIYNFLKVKLCYRTYWKQLVAFLTMCFLVLSCSQQNDCKIGGKKLLIVYPDKTETLYFTDFQDITKDFWAGGSMVEINIEEFNSLEEKKAFADYKQGRNIPIFLDSDINNNQIYILNIFENKLTATEYNENEYKLKTVWSFEDNYQNFIYNNTGKDLFLETVVYGSGGFTNEPIKRIRPKNIIESSLPDYFFSDEPPLSINTTSSYNQTYRYWLRY